MKRDMDLVREILLAVESDNSPFGMNEVEIEGRTPQQVGYHIGLMVEAGLVNAHDVTEYDGNAKSWHAISLTWSGHEFLDAAREPSRWESAKTVIKEKAGTVSFEVLKQVLISLALNAIGL